MSKFYKAAINGKINTELCQVLFKNEKAFENKRKFIRIADTLVELIFKLRFCHHTREEIAHEANFSGVSKLFLPQRNLQVDEAPVVVDVSLYKEQKTV